VLSSLRRVGRQAAHYLRYHPETVLVFGRHALGRRVAIPLDLIRWGLEHALSAPQKPESMVITARPPALAFDAVLALMGNNRLRVGASILVESIEFEASSVRVAFRVHEVDVEALTPESPLGKMVSSGFLDFSKPASLLSFVPKRPAFIVDAKADRFVVDLMQVPALSENQALRRSLSALSSVFSVREVRTEGDWLVFQIASQLRAVIAALSALRAPAHST